MPQRTLQSDSRGLPSTPPRGRWGAPAVIGLLLLSTVPGCGRPSPASDTPSSPRLASVHGRDIRVEDFRLYWDDQRMATNSMPLREQVLEHLIQRSALAEEARRTGLDRDPAVQQGIDLILARRIRTTRLEPRLKSIQILDAEVEEAYRKQRDTRFTEPESVRAAVLWFNTRGQQPLEERYRPRLESVRTHLLADRFWIAPSNGFGALSITNSEHRVTRFNGGDTGWMRSNGSSEPWRTEVLRIAGTLRQPGDLSEVVAGPDGLFLVRLLDRRPPTVKPLESVRDEIRRSLLAERRRQVEESFDHEILAAAQVQRFPKPLEDLTNLPTVPRETPHPLFSVPGGRPSSPGTTPTRLPE